MGSTSTSVCYVVTLPYGCCDSVGVCGCRYFGHMTFPSTFLIALAHLTFPSIFLVALEHGPGCNSTTLVGDRRCSHSTFGNLAVSQMLRNRLSRKSTRSIHMLHVRSIWYVYARVLIVPQACRMESFDTSSYNLFVVIYFTRDHR
jgi:hypothetical protein